jgi:precorrin-6B methylase 2
MDLVLNNLYCDFFQADSILRRFWQKIRDDGKVILNKLLVEMLEAQLKMERK